MIDKETYLKKKSAARREIRHQVNRALVRGEAVLIHQAPLFAILAAIHAKIAPANEARRKAQDWLNGTGRNEDQGFTFDLEKYSNGYEYAMGRQTENDLACENEPRFAIIQESVKIVENKGIEPSSPDYENSEVAFLSRD